MDEVKSVKDITNDFNNKVDKLDTTSIKSDREYIEVDNNNWECDRWFEYVEAIRNIENTDIDTSFNNGVEHTDINGNIVNDK